MGKSRENVSKRNIVLNIETYKRLEKFLLELIKDRKSPRITFNEAVKALLDEHEEGRGS